MPIRLTFASIPNNLSNSTVKQKTAFWIASGLGTGLLPASGTWGALLAFAVHNVLMPDLLTINHWMWCIGVVVLVSALGVWSADVTEKLTGKKDDSRVTIDEVAGYFVAVMLLPAGFYYTIPAFILCRIFDIIKPPPANGFQSLRGGWGIMIDDLIASVYACILFHGIIYAGLW